MGNIKAGKYVDDEGEPLNDVEKVLRKNGIELRKSETEFRDFGEVLDEVASKWELYDDVTQHAIATALAGTRQQNKLYTLMQNYGQALKYEAVAANSAGTANEKYTNSYLNGIQARKNALTAAYENLSQTILNSELIKIFYEGITKIINLVDGFLNNQLGRVATQFTLIFALFYKGLPFIINSFKSIKTIGTTIITSIRNMGVETDAAATKTAALSSAWQGVLGIIGLVLAAITAVYSEYSRTQQSINEANRKVLEDWKEKKKDADEFQRLYDQYKKLNPQLDEYKTVEDKIIKLLGDKATALKNATEKTDAYRESIKKLTEEELADLEARRQDAAISAKSLFSDSYNFDTGKIQYLMNPLEVGWNYKSKDQIQLRDEKFSFSEYLKDLGIDTELAGSNSNGNLRIGIAATDVYKTVFGNFSDRLSAYLQVLKAYEALEEKAKTLDTDDALKFRGSEAFLSIKRAVKDKQSLFDDLISSYVDLYATGKSFETDEEKEKLYNSLENKIIKALGFSTGAMGKGKYKYPLLVDAIDNALDNLFDVNGGGGDTGKGARYIQTLLDTLKSEDLEKATETVSDLSKAIEEMEGNGKISLETAQKLAEYGEDYVDTIAIENGALKINSQALAALAIHKISDAKATAIQNNATEETIALYDKLIEDVKKLGQSQSFGRLASLLDYTNTVLEYAGGYDSTRLNNYDRVRKAALEEIKYYRAAGYASDSDEIMSLYKSYIDYSEKMIALQKEMYDNDNDAFKESIESENDALEKQKDLLDKIYDARKKALDVAKDEYAYQKELTSKQKKVADLQTQLAVARLDTSASGRARVRDLESQYNQAQEDLDEFNLEHAIDIVSAKIDEEKEANDALYEKQKADNDARLDLYIAENEKRLKAYEDQIKDDYDIVSEALGDLTGESGVVNKLKNILDSVKNIEDTIGKDKPNVFMQIYMDPDDPNIKNKSNYWKYKTDQIFGRRDTIGVLHSGGIVDDLKLKDNETFAKLMKGEYVATPAQMSRFINSTLPNLTKGKTGQEFNAPLVSIHVESVDKESLPKLESIVKMAADKIKSDLTSAFDKSGYRSTNKKILSY